VTNNFPVETDLSLPTETKVYYQQITTITHIYTKSVLAAVQHEVAHEN